MVKIRTILLCNNKVAFFLNYADSYAEYFGQSSQNQLCGYTRYIETIIKNCTVELHYDAVSF